MRREYMPRSFDYRSLMTSTTTGHLSPEQMTNHSVARLRCSLVAGVDIALMRANNLIRPGTRLSAAGAAVQDDRGNRSHHAAHALPAGMLANGMPLHQAQKSLQMQMFVAEPYRFTNILPRDANMADSRAERIPQGGGRGLVCDFERYCQRIAMTGTAPRGRVDRGTLKLAFRELLTHYSESFELALRITPDISVGRVVRVPGGGTEVDVSPLNAKDYREDDIRTALRVQQAALKDVGQSAFSLLLVDQVESDFYSALSEIGQV